MNILKIFFLLLAIALDYYINNNIYNFIPKDIYFPYAIWVCTLIYVWTEYDLKIAFKPLIVRR